MNTENNRIIAEFLAHEVITHNQYSDQLREQRKEGIQFEIKSLIDTELKYHSDWNWLMEVVEKIETKKYYKKEVQFSITKYSVKIQTLTNEDGLIISPCIFSSWGTYGGTQKMKAIYNACLEFIKWYNLQNS